MRKLDICHFGIGLRIRTPIPRAAPIRRPAHRLFWPRTTVASQRAIDVTDQPAVEVVMQHFTTGDCGITMILEIALESGHIVEGR